MDGLFDLRALLERRGVSWRHEVDPILADISGPFVGLSLIISGCIPRDGDLCDIVRSESLGIFAGGHV